MGLGEVTAAPQPDLQAVREAGRRGFIAMILSLVGALIPYIGPVISIVGAVLLLIALHGLAQELGERRIFMYAIYVLVISVVAALLGMAALVMGVLSGHILGTAIGALFALYLVLVIDGYLFRSIFTMLSERTASLSQDSSQNFSSAAKWYWIGALLVIVIVGAVLVIVGEVYAIMAFDALSKVEAPQPSLVPPSSSGLPP